MSSSPVQGGIVHSRTTSLTASLREQRPPVIAQRRGPSLGQRPPLSSGTHAKAAGGTGAATTGAAKSAAAPAAAPATPAAKRLAAKRTSLRTRMPYLRPSATPTAAEAKTDACTRPNHPPQRSFSSSASTHGATPWVKASYTIIPEALQVVKKICGASKEAADKESSVVLSSSFGRERRLSRPSSVSGGKGGDGSDDAATVIHSVELVQGMLFSSLQTTTAVDALTPLSPHRDGAGSHFQRSKSCSSQLESPLIPAAAASGIFLSKKDRGKAWALLLHKHTHAFLTLITAARSPLATREAAVAATLLTFLYNVLRHMSGERQRKAVLLCEKLGVIRVCTAVLQESRRRLRFEAATGPARAACLRTCEAAGLLFTLCHTFNGKVAAAFRLSQSLDCSLACATTVFAVVEAEFASLQQTVHAMTAEAHTEGPTRKETLKALRSFQARTLWSITAFSHFCFTLFVFTANAVAAREVGARGAELCSTAIAMSTYFLSQLAPVLLAHVVYERPEDTLHPAVGPLMALDAGHWAPAWVVKLLRHVELMLLWCVALLHRLGSCAKVQEEVTAVALRSHVPRACLLFLAPAPHGTLQLAPRRECVHVVLLLLGTVLHADRVGALADMSGLGGLPSLIASVLSLSEPSAQQWQDFYVQLSAMCGCLRLPALSGHEASYVDQRVPAVLRRLRPADAEPASPTAVASPVTALLAASPATGEDAPHGGEDTGGSSSTGTTVSQSLSPAEKFVSVPEPALCPSRQTPDEPQDRLRDGLMLVDTQPALFSPELHGGTVDALSALSDFVAEQLPSPATAPPPPTTAERWQGTPSHVADISGDAHLQTPLREVSQEDRVRVLRHHVARLARLDAAACDGTAQPHEHKVVFERVSGAAPEVAGVCAAAVQPSHGGLVFFSDFESGNLQRAIEVSEDEYDLVLSWDTATNSYTQWFNFGLRGFTPGKTYRFNILNMEKLGSTFNDGQKPLLLHVPEETAEGVGQTPPQWQRVGHDIFYFHNTYERPPRDHFFPKDMEMGSTATANAAAAAATAASAPAAVLSASGSSKTGGSAQASPVLHAVAPRCSPVRSFTCTPAPRLSPSRTPPTPPPVVAAAVPATSAAAAANAAKKRPVANAARTAAGGGDDGEESGKKQKNFFTVSFSVTMPSNGSGAVYLANCFPFTYTELRQHLSWLEGQTAGDDTRAVRAQTLCVTPGGLPVPLLTVTALRRRNGGEAYTAEEIRRRPIALLVARVHPGETNASWVMQGLLDALLCPSAATAALAATLCETYVFKIVPMLNADGVVMGNHRCSLAGMDMNRDYLEPKAELNPTLFALKQLLHYWRQEEGRQTVLFADFHGHSRAKNFLVYGCTSETMRSIARQQGKKGKKGKDPQQQQRRRRVRVRQTSTDAPLGPEKMFATLLNHIFPSFSLSQSSFAVTKDKVSSARVVLYEEFGVRMSYGFEATMVGGRLSVPALLQPMSEAEGGAPYREEVHYSPLVFRAMGEAFVRALAVLSEQWVALTVPAAALGDSASSELLAKSTASDTRGRAEVLQALWSATAAAGAGKDAAKGRSAEVPKEVAPAEPRAGPYALATRCDRRLGTAGAASPVHEAAPQLPPVSTAGQLDALNYLFLADLRGAAVLGGDGDADDDQRSVDGSEVSSVMEGSEDEGEGRGGRGAAGRGRGGKRRVRRGTAEGSEAGDRSGSSAGSDSGSDDHDWSDMGSSAGSSAEDIDDERSSASSVNDDIPTNLFS